jgi:hypothetical protein
VIAGPDVMHLAELRDLVPLEPKVQELKLYVPGVGPVLSVHLDGAGGRAELISYTPGH